MTALGAGRRDPLQLLRGWAQRLARPADARPVSVTVRAVTWSLVSLAGLACWLVAFGLFFSGLDEAHQQHDLYANFRAALSPAGNAPVQGPIAVGQPVALLSAPAGGLDNMVVVEGTSSTALRAGPGHQPGAPLPGQAGDVMIMGRAVSYGAPFAGITRLRRGDVITAVCGLGTFTYTVLDVRRPGDPMPTSLPASGGLLTLVTAEGGGWRSGWAPSNAVYVDAALQGKAVASGTASGVLHSSDLPMHGDTRGLYPLILWLQLLLVTVVGAVWARVRWGLWQTWLVALPVGFAALWGASESFWLLLPNVL